MCENVKRQLKVVSVFGTRPETIKLAPVIHAMEQSPLFDSKIVLTGQHKDMCDPYIRFFGLNVDSDMEIMEPNQSLDTITAKILMRLPLIFKKYTPDIVLVQGDTSSAFAAALASFHAKIPVGHIEAGLRTDDPYCPFPEEMNRRIISSLAAFHFAPTQNAATNLRVEGVSEENILVAGNTVIDALLGAIRKDYDFSTRELRQIDFKNRKIITVTVHRRESFGGPLESILNALLRIVREDDSIEIVFPVHYNPNIRESVSRILRGEERIKLMDPLPYGDFIHLLDRSYLILSDSGGVQEEAISLDVPVLVLRDNTERMEGVDAGAVKLVGRDEEDIVREVRELSESKEQYQRMAQVQNPYGDGEASERILSMLSDRIDLGKT